MTIFIAMWQGDFFRKSEMAAAVMILSIVFSK